MTTILTTTGISLFINTGRNYNTKEPTDDQMRQYLRMKPEAASAEANSLLQITQTDDHLVFFRTETLEAERCANLLKEFFLSRGFKNVHIVELQFQDDEKHIETHGLRNLVNALISEIEAAQRKGQQVVINATPGFKLESAYSTMIGMLYQVPVKYIHEKFKRVVTFNPIALVWDTSLFLTYDKFFLWLDAEPRRQQDIKKYLEGLADRESIEALLTPPDSDGYAFLSPMGEVLRRRFARETEEAELVDWPPSAGVKDVEDKIASSLLYRKHHPIKGSLSACYKIAALDYVQEIIGGHFENTPRSHIRRVDPDGTILLLWADDQRAERLTIYTTARGRPQTIKVAEKIKEILELK